MILSTRILFRGLQTILDVIDGSPVPPGASNPLASVDNLFYELIECTPPDITAATMHILGACKICPDLPLVHFAHILRLKLEDFYEALLTLHSVIYVPSGAKVSEESLRFFHASFPDFLMNPERSGCFAQDVNLHHLSL